MENKAVVTKLPTINVLDKLMGSLSVFASFIYLFVECYYNLLKSICVANLYFLLLMRMSFYN